MAEPIVTPKNHRTGSRGRPSPLNDPDFVKVVAQAFVDGCSRNEMCEMFGVSDPGTITRWRRDPRVKALTMKLIEDRVLQITRKVDGRIAQILEECDELTVQELIMIRKEFLGGALRQQTEKADAETVTEAMEALEENPDLINILSEAVQNNGGSKE